MAIRNASPGLYNEDLAPATTRNWGAFSIFNVWTSDVHSLWGYYLAASLFLLCGGFVNFILAIGIGSIVIYLLMSLIGNAGVRTGVPYPVLARASFGVWGANLPALVRAIVACFWYGAQTSLASGAIVALLIRNDAFRSFHEVDALARPFRPRSDLLRRRLGAAIADHPARHGDGATVPGLGRTGGVGDDAGAGDWPDRQGRRRQPVGRHPGRRAGRQDQGRRGSAESRARWRRCSPSAATWITYFAALYLNFCDFSRYAPNTAAVRKGNIWGLPINLVLFTLVAGLTTIAAYQVYGEALLHPEQISAKFDSWFLALLAAITFAVATLGINVVANFVSPAFDFANVAPSVIDFKKGGYIAALIALVLYPFAPWESGAAAFVNLIGATMGPIFGVLMVDYYLIAKGRIDVEALYDANGVYRYAGGWNPNALIAAAIGALFSSILPNFTNWLPSWWGVYGWFFGVAISGGVYYALSLSRRLAARRRKAPNRRRRRRRRSQAAGDRQQRAGDRAGFARGEKQDRRGEVGRRDPLAEIGVGHVGAIGRRVDGRRQHGVDRHAAPLEFFGEAFGEAVDARLAGGVGAHAGRRPCSAASAPTLTIRPAPLSIRNGNAACDALTAVIRLTANIRCQLAAAPPSIFSHTKPPATLISASSRPNRALTAAIAARAWSADGQVDAAE